MAKYDLSYAIEHRRKTIDWEMQEIIRLLNPKENEKILDIGCNTGEFCNILQKNYKCQPTGIDVNPHAILIARRKYPQVTFETGSVEKLSYKNKYNKVTMTEVIEHLGNPENTLNKIRELLTDNGRLVLSTPNKWAFLNKLRNRIDGGGLIVWDETHIQELNPISLSSLLKKTGFKIEKLYTKILGIPGIRKISETLYRNFPSGPFGIVLFCRTVIALK